MNPAARLVVGVIAGSAVALAGYRVRSLTISGAVAATLTGAAAVAAGWSWAIVLITYFGTSSALSRLGKTHKRTLMDGFIEKPGARDATQVFANGFPFLACAVIASTIGHDHLFWFTVAAGSLAASAGDTWATEIGTLVGHAPRSILTFRRLAVGESGGVTIPGSLAALAGAAFVAGLAVLTGWPTAVVMPVVGGGMAGAIADSVVGASLQRRSWCDVCHKATEMRIHDCGNATRHAGGLAFLENDGVNLIATVTGAVVAALLLR